MQNVRVNNKIFSSISKAAKFIGMQRSNLSNMLKNKKATTYKDLMIEKLDTPKTVKKPKHTRKGIPVLVDGIPYKNCAEAERAIGCASSSISDALRRGANTVYGHKVEAVYPSMIKNKKPMKKSTNCKVMCKTTGVIYPTITQAAMAAGCDDWTMSKKMEAAGGFVDKNNNEYIRLTPMKSKNTYIDDGKYIKKPRVLSSRKNNHNSERIAGANIEKDAQISSPQTAEFMVKTPDFDEIPQVVKDAINDKIISLLKEKGVYNDVMDLLKYGGFTTVEF